MMITKEQLLTPVSDMKQEDTSIVKLTIQLHADYHLSDTYPMLKLITSESDISANKIVGIVGNILKFHTSCFNAEQKSIQKLKKDIWKKVYKTNLKPGENVPMLALALKVYGISGNERGKRYADSYKSLKYSNVSNIESIYGGAKYKDFALIAKYNELNEQCEKEMHEFEIKNKEKIKGKKSDTPEKKIYEEEKREIKNKNSKKLRDFLIYNRDKMSTRYSSVARREYVSKDSLKNSEFYIKCDKEIAKIIEEASGESAYLGNKEGLATIYTEIVNSIPEEYSDLEFITKPKLDVIQRYGKQAIAVRQNVKDPSVSDSKKDVCELIEISSYECEDGSKISNGDIRSFRLSRRQDNRRVLNKLSYHSQIYSVKKVEESLKNINENSNIEMKELFDPRFSPWNFNPFWQKSNPIRGLDVRHQLYSLAAFMTPFKFFFLGNQKRVAIFPSVDDESLRLWIEIIKRTDSNIERAGTISVKQNKKGSSSKDDDGEVKDDFQIPFRDGNFEIEGLNSPWDLNGKLLYFMAYLSKMYNTANDEETQRVVKNFFIRNKELNLYVIDNEGRSMLFGFGQKEMGLFLQPFFREVMATIIKKQPRNKNDIPNFYENIRYSFKHPKLNNFYKTIKSLHRDKEEKETLNNDISDYIEHTAKMTIEKETFEGLKSYAMKTRNSIYQSLKQDLKRKPTPEESWRAFENAIYMIQSSRTCRDVISVPIRMRLTQSMSTNELINSAIQKVYEGKVNIDDLKSIMSIYIRFYSEKDKEQDV